MKWRFCPGSRDYQRHAVGGEEAVVAVDASDRRRMGDVLSASMADLPLLVIDHHVTNAGFGTRESD